MDSIKYMLTRFSRINNLRREDFPFGFGVRGPSTATTQAKAILGYKKGAESYIGTSEVTFNRIDLGLMFKNVTPVVTMFQPRSHKAVFAELLRVYGLPGEDEEAVLSEIVNTAIDPAAEVTSVTLVVGNGNLYKGSVTVTIEPKVMPLDEIVVYRELPVLVERFSLMNTLLVSERHFYHYDFTFHPLIAALRAAVPGTRLNVGFFNDPDVWQECGKIQFYPQLYSHSGVPYNTYNTNGSPCVYNGPARDYPDANPEYKYVAVYNPATACVGRYLLHYN